MIYLSDYKLHEGSGELCMYSATNGVKKIASDIGKYQFKDNYTYYIGEENKLYKKNIEEEKSEALENDVYDFYITNNVYD